MMWNVRVECVRKMKGVTVKMETVTLSGTGRQNVSCCMY